MTQPNSTNSPRTSASHWLLLILLSLAILPELRAATLTGQVTDVPNGHQVSLKSDEGERLTIVLAGISSPSIAAGRPDIGRRFLHTLVAGRQVTVEFKARSQGGVIIGRVLYGGADIALRLLRSGLAEVADDPSPLNPVLLLHYQQAEQSARLHRMGYWQSRH
jgi:endonuclease YncB( thermonuclease family)